MIKASAGKIWAFLSAERLQASPAGVLALRLAGAAAALWLLTALVFLPAAQNGFVNWDDKHNFLDNTDYRGTPAQQRRWVLTSLDAGFYVPLTRLAQVANYRLWALEPSGWHLDSVLLHACNAALFLPLAFMLLSRAGAPGTRAGPAAVFAALLFALHPLRAEPVAWASGQHDLICLFFYLLTVMFYLRLREAATARRRTVLYFASGLSFALALLAKPTGMLLPAVLVLLDLGLYGASALKERWYAALRGKLHLVLLVIPAAAVTLLSHNKAQSVYSFERYDALNRLTQAVYGSVFYLKKTLLPLDLSPLYQINTLPLPWDPPYRLYAAAFLLITALGILQARRGRPWPLLAWCAYLLLLAPVSGLAQSGYQIAADRYSYFAMLPLTLLAAALAGRAGRASFLIMLLPAALIPLTQPQLRIWKDSETLWRKAVAAEPLATYSLDNLGDALSDEGKLKEAIPFYERAVVQNPVFYEGQNDLATAYFETGQVRRAIRHLLFAVQAKPDYALGHQNLANIYLLVAGNYGAAAYHYRKLVEIDPAKAAYRTGLGHALYMMGKFPEALRCFEKALELEPGNKEAAYGRELSHEALKAAGKNSFWPG